VEHKIATHLTVSSTLKKPSKNYTCFILRRFGLFLIHLQSKIKARAVVLKLYEPVEHLRYSQNLFRTPICCTVIVHETEDFYFDIHGS